MSINKNTSVTSNKGRRKKDNKPLRRKNEYAKNTNSILAATLLQ